MKAPNHQAAVKRKQRLIERDLQRLVKQLDSTRPRVKFFEHPPFRVGGVCWG